MSNITINRWCVCAVRVTVVALCFFVCVCVCVWGVVKDQRELEINIRKEKVKRVRGICRCQ